MRLGRRIQSIMAVDVSLDIKDKITMIIATRQVTRATHVRNRVCPRVELILKSELYC